MAIFTENFNNSNYSLITLTNEKMKVVLTDIGASLVSVFVKDKNNNEIDVVLGYNDPKGYLENNIYLGAIVGRNANRIEDGILKIDEITYNLDKNNENNNLHSGFNKTASIKWNYTINETENSITFYTLLEDGFQNMPGNFNINVKYLLTKNNELELHYTGYCDKKTIANFTNHTYFNLDGHKTGNILDQELMLNAKYFTPFKENTNVPSGEILSVYNTPLDFTNFKKIGKEIEENYPQLKYANGYDHNFVIDKKIDGIELIAKAKSEKSGITLEVYSNLEGVQFYTGNYNDVENYGKEDAKYLFRSGFCLETQHFPNSCNIKHFKSPILNANEKYDTKTIFKFL